MMKKQSIQIILNISIETADTNDIDDTIIKKIIDSEIGISKSKSKLVHPQYLYKHDLVGITYLNKQ